MDKERSELAIAPDPLQKSASPNDLTYSWCVKANLHKLKVNVGINSQQKISNSNENNILHDQVKFKSEQIRLTKAYFMLAISMFITAIAI